MAEVWIWNSMACRRRSASDTFEENGLAIIKSHIEAKGHNVKLIDFATAQGYNSLSPYLLRKFNYLFLRLSLSQIFRGKRMWSQLSQNLQNKLYSKQSASLKKQLFSLSIEVKKQKLPIFGIKVWYGEAFTWSKLLCELIHTHSPETMVIAGGYHATLYEEDLLVSSNFDFAITGAGEETLKHILNLPLEYDKKHNQNLIQSEIDNNNISGIIGRKNGAIFNAKQLCGNTDIVKAIPQYQKDNGKTKIHILTESTGCAWGKCNFCVHNKLVPNHSRRSVKEVITEIKALNKQGIGIFRLSGSYTPLDYCTELSAAIKKEQLNVEFSMGSRAFQNCRQNYDKIVPALCCLIQAGLKGVFIGGETGYDAINEAVMNKGVCSEDIIYTIKAFREAERKTSTKTFVTLALIYPTPLIDDTHQDDVFKANINLINSSRPDSVMVTPPAPFKHTDWFNNPQKYGFHFDENFIQDLMEYEYVLYKPVSMWPDLNLGLRDMNFRQMLNATQKLRNTIEQELKIPCDLSDEHFLMLRSAGLTSPKQIIKFKHKSMLSIASSDYGYINHISKKVNKQSNKLAYSNLNQ